MKELNDFADDINKCSKCGLCQSVCPVYKITGNDCAVSRGKFVMLDGVLKGDLKLGKNIEKYLDMCLKCGKCKSFCPSGIDVCEIFNIAKHECTKNTFHGKFAKFLQSDFVFGKIIKIFYFFSHLFDSTFNLNSQTAWNTVSLSPPAHRRRARHTFSCSTQKSCSSALSQDVLGLTKLLYFKGCVNNVFPKVESDLKKVFKHFDVEIIERDFDCCGLPFLSSGNYERFEEVKKHNLELTDCEYDYILTDCASCESTIKSYGDLKTINAAEFAAAQNVKYKFSKPLKVTFHKPCHLENIDFIRPLLEKCENVEYIEMKDFDECCGFAGEFALKNPKISSAISKIKAKNIIDTNADIVLTTCPACILGILEGYTALGILHKNPPKVLNIMEFLAKADDVICSK